ncbi:MAG: FAD-binding protein, partial [Lentisphaeraceae bacterium]|nr:FAD-binding protein [Lentisphaeraceae bacterium]
MDSKTKRDVIIIGAGAAGLTAALHLSKQNLKVSVLDGAIHPGSENWSGCVFFGENLADEEILGPGWLSETAIERKLVCRGVYMTNGVDTAGISYHNPNTFKNCATVLRPVFDHDLAEIARSRGIEILSRTNVIGLLKENDQVIGVATEKGPLYADLVFLAEGDAAHILQKEGYSNLKEGDKGHFLQGIKEVIELSPHTIEERFKLQKDEGAAYEMIIRNARIGGKTVKLNMGAFIYTNRESLSIGLVLPLDNLAEHFKGDHNNLMEWFKSLPAIKHWTAGGKRTAFGAKIINANGYKNLSQLCDNGLAIGGTCTGIGLDFPYPNYTGPASFTGLCLGKAVKAIKESNGDFSRENLEEYYVKAIKESQYFQDLKTTQNWADYIGKTDNFFSLLPDVKLDIAHPFFENKSFLTATRDACRSFFYHSRGGKLKKLIADLKVQQQAAGAMKVGPLQILSAYFSSAPLNIASNDEGDLRLQVFHKEEDVTDNMAPPLKTFYKINNNTIKAAFDVIYRNHGENLDQRFLTLNHIIAKKGFLSLLLGAVSSPFILATVGVCALLDNFTDKKTLLQSDTAKLVMEARKAQELSSFTPETNIEEKLADIIYETDKKSHIKVHWPAQQYLPESDPNRDLFHICPAGVYHAEKDIMGMLRPVVDYENCVKCESCWRGSSLVDWGRRGSHRLQYRVQTTAVATLLRHQAIEAQSWQIGHSSTFNSPLNIDKTLRELLNSVSRDIKRIHELIHSENRTLNASERVFIQTLQRDLNFQLVDFPRGNYDQRSQNLLLSLIHSCERIQSFINIERFYWIDSELQVMQQHALKQLGIEPQVDHSEISNKPLPATQQASDHFTIARLHKIKHDGMSCEDLKLIDSYCKNSHGENGLQEISELAKIDLGLSALFISRHLASAINNERPNPGLLICEDLQIDDDGKLSGSIPFALSAGIDSWILIAPQGTWKVSRSALGLTSTSLGSIGLRLAQIKKITLDQTPGEKLKYQGLAQLQKDGAALFVQTIISAGEYLLQKSIDHGIGRIQFPDLFQDEHGRDGIIKFGAVKSLIAHMAARLECLKAAAKSNIAANMLYVQAGKWLGTQEGSFTYNATQVYGGTGFSEDDTLSPYYRDATIFKYLL